MYSTNFLRDSRCKEILSEPSGKYHIVDYTTDMSVNPQTAVQAYFASKMNVHKRQLVVKLNNDSVVMQAGAMQWMAGNIQIKTDVKGVGDFAKKMFGASVTNETAIKPLYQGVGEIVLEPTYKFILLEDLNDWNGSMVIEDGMFLACDGGVQIKTVMRKSISSAALGNEGLFNTCLAGKGIVALESPVPEEELVCVQLDNDVLKVDGSFAVAWSRELDFTVERTTKTMIGSAASGEGLVNVYRGTGKVLLAPIM